MIKLKNKTYRSFNTQLGANILSDNQVQFQLWAPDAKKVDLIINENGKLSSFEMTKGKNAIFSIIKSNIATGTLYKYKINDDLCVPDPISRFQHGDAHDYSIVVDPKEFKWDENSNWKGKEWEDTSIYELHIGTFTKEGTYKAAIEKIDYLADLGITAIELMPVAACPGERNWGYDGVLLYAPNSTYGTPNDLKELIKTAHSKGIMVFLDVVYNHFGPDANYLYCYAKSEFFDSTQNTPWGDAINFKNQAVRDFYINNALYWIEEYQFDGLRFDAVHAIYDNSQKHILESISEAVQEKYQGNRHIHLMLENEDNQSSFLGKNKYTAQWNDDSHHAMHVASTDEKSGYYTDYTEETTGKLVSYFLARTFTEGFAYQGEKSAYRKGEIRGEASKDFSPAAFINFIQNHDQVGNRAFGERISDLTDNESYKALASLYLLAPTIPMLFMGEELASSSPFLFFCDFNDDLATAVRNGRKKEFSKFPEFNDPKTQELIPDPTSKDTFEKSKIKWDELSKPPHNEIYELYKTLLNIRKNKITPILKNIDQTKTQSKLLGKNTFWAKWESTGNAIEVFVNLDKQEQKVKFLPQGSLLFESNKHSANNIAEKNIIMPSTVCWYITVKSE